ncbi:MAG: hypothetical protein JNM27_21435 [Leptospirales bacterium]|nr:hypothetical protein [Leptospirales bacterium]
MLSVQLDRKGNLLIARVAGIVPSGSEGNQTVAPARDQILRAIDGDPSLTSLLLDFSRLQYSFGDSVGSLWILPWQRRLAVVILATGATAAALRSLIALSIPVPLVSEEAEAIRLCESTQQRR